MSEETGINIIVSGRASSGKSRLTFLLKEFLKEKGFDIQMDDHPDFNNETQFDEFMVKNIDLAIKSISEREKISIKTISINTKLIKTKTL